MPDTSTLSQAPRFVCAGTAMTTHTEPNSTDHVPPAPSSGKLDSQTLFGDKRELQIVHQGETYRLSITRHNKLILTK